MEKDIVHIYNGILLSHKKNEIMPFVAIWLDLKIVILSDVRARQICDIAYMWNLNNGTNELTYKIEIGSQM